MLTEAPLQRGAMGFPASGVVEEQDRAGCPLRAPFPICPCVITCSTRIWGEKRARGAKELQEVNKQVLRAVSIPGKKSVTALSSSS